MITPTFILLLVVASTNAHNWLNSLSRSTGANTRKPAAPSKTGQPHAQVAAGQFLQAEWVQGHGSDSYFILVAEKDYNQLNKHTDEKLLNAYLSEAGATKGVPSRMHSKYHRVYSTGTPSRNHGSRNNYFTGFVPRTAAHFIERDRMFTGRFTGAPRGRGNDLDPKNVHQAIYPNDCTKTDRYSAHKSSKYAWILSVWKFRICVHNPNRPDVAGFQIPPGTPPGKYFLHWKWRGYYDIIDVQVVTGAPVANPYGAKLAPGATPPPAAWKRIEHCEFLKPQKTYGCLALKEGESEEQCLKDCARSAFKDCNGVNVVTVHNPTSVYPAFRDMVNIPFGAQCPKQTLEVNPPNSRRRACYSLITREDSDLPDEQELIATEDPDEPAFYSTCWKRLPPVSFDMPPAADEYRPPTFMFGHKCISCDQAFANLNTAKPQYWDIKTEDCENCALRPMPTAPPLAQVLMGTRISGIHLVRTPSDVRSQPIQPGEKIPLPNTDVAFVIRCDFTPGAVKIVVDPPSGANVVRTEMKVPFASHGDNNGNYPGMAPQKGKWRVTATVDNNKSGTIEFEFV